MSPTPRDPEVASEAEEPIDPLEAERILAALETLDPQRSERSRQARAYVELVGVLAEQLPPTPPRPQAKRALFAALGLATSGSGTPASPSVVPFARRARPVAGAPAWALAAAVLVAFALAASSGFFYSEMRREQSVSDGLRAELALLEQRPIVAETAGLDGQLRALEAGFQMVTAPGTRLCKLDSRDPNQPEAAAAVFLQPDRGRWFLDARGLRRCPLGRVYQVWFMTGEGPVKGSAFQIKDDSPILIGSDDLPPGTQAVMVTLEHPEKVGSEPGGATVLFGDQPRELL
ncbi:MAG: hypothetical protein DWQ36_15900 [Acidobacteria bacterium]|nr:MAG: hypothetical protein DWQ30_14575 [Acidobacteriota bacterium]REK05594.1 MAG: hypothetical protein DWQ36_15900 [Acidobacteriota bacterium]